MGICYISFVFANIYINPIRSFLFISAFILYYLREKKFSLISGATVNGSAPAAMQSGFVSSAYKLDPSGNISELYYGNGISGADENLSVYSGNNGTYKKSLSKFAGAFITNKTALIGGVDNDKVYLYDTETIKEDCLYDYEIILPRCR